MYYVVVCPDKYCRGITILSKKTKSAKCRKCDTSYKFDKFKVSYETDSHSNAVAARTQLITKQSDNGPDFEEIKESGGLDEPDYSSDNERDTRTPVEIIESIIKETDNASKENIIEEAIVEGLTEKKANKLVERFLQKGRAIKNNGKISLI